MLLRRNAKPKVHNRHHGTAPVDAIYIGRGTEWGNPFVINDDNTRDDVCDKFEKYVKSDPEFITRIKDKLKGKHLVCSCSPRRCHGDLLLSIANED